MESATGSGDRTPPTTARASPAAHTRKPKKEKNWEKKGNRKTGSDQIIGSMLEHQSKLVGEIDALKEKLRDSKKDPPPKEPSWMEKRQTIPSQRNIDLAPFWVNEGWLHNRKWNFRTIGISAFIAGRSFFENSSVKYEDCGSYEMLFPERVDMRYDGSRMVEDEYQPLYHIIRVTKYTKMFSTSRDMIISLELAAALLDPMIVSPCALIDDVKVAMSRALARQQKIGLDRYMKLEGDDVYQNTFDYCWSHYLAHKRDFHNPAVVRNQSSWRTVIGWVMLCCLLLEMLRVVAEYDQYCVCLNQEHPWQCLWAAMCEDWHVLSRTLRILIQL